MIFIHLTPYNEELEPWLLEYIEVYDNNNLNNQGYCKERVVITPPYGYAPSPKYAISFSEDYTEIVNNAFSYTQAGELLKNIINKHEHIIFSGLRSIAMFKKLCARLLLPNLLTPYKKVSSFKTLLKAAMLFKQVYPLEFEGKFKQLSNTISGDGFLIKPESSYNITLLDYVYNIYQDLLRKQPKLLSYFINKQYRFPTDLRNNNKFTIAITDDSFFVFLPLFDTVSDIVGIDLKSAIDSSNSKTENHKSIFVLPKYGSTLFCVNTVLKDIPLQFTKYNLNEIEQLKNKYIKDFIQQELFYDYLHQAQDALNNKYLDIYSLLINNKVDQVYEDHKFIKITNSRRDYLQLNNEIIKLKDQSFEFVLDYMLHECPNKISTYHLKGYQNVINERILKYQDRIEKQFEEIANKAIGNEKITQKLENLYSLIP